MNIEYYLLDPTGNITALAVSPVEPALQPLAGKAIMAAEPTAEQVGFITPEGGKKTALRMAGGEFCGNATMSAAVLKAVSQGIKPGEEMRISVKVSGVEKRLDARVINDNGIFRAGVNMPAPDEISERTLELDGESFTLPAVFFGKTAHFICTLPLSRAKAERAAKKWCGELGCDCLGIMLLESGESRLTPLVYVPAADTMFWESSCASGTTAAGAYLHTLTGSDAPLTFTEPGGKLNTTFGADGITLAGTVKILKKSSISF